MTADEELLATLGYARFTWLWSLPAMKSEFMQESGKMFLLVGRDKHYGSFAHRIQQKSNLSDACLCQECKRVDFHYFTFENFS